MHVCIHTKTATIWGAGEDGETAISDAVARWEAAGNGAFVPERFMAPLADDAVALAFLAGDNPEWDWSAGIGSQVVPG